MNRPVIVATAVVAAALLGAAGYGLYQAGMQRGTAAASQATSAAAPPPAGAGSEPLPQSIAQGEAATRRHIASGLKAGDVDPATGRRILYYHDPMVPGNRFDRPAKSPFMDMMLVPVYAGAGGDDASKVTVSPRVQQSLGVRTAPVTEGTLALRVAAVGSIAWNERNQVVVPARSAGFVEKLHVRAAMDRVAQGQPLAELFVPEWLAAQEELLALRRMRGDDLAPLVDGARQRLRQAGMNEAQIALVERSGRAQPRWTLVAPIAGVVSELAAREGMSVAAGTSLFRIHGTATVWAHAEVPETQAALLRPGAKVQATSPALPGRTLTGTVQALLPEVSAATRTVKARVELRNPGGHLVPGVFVRMEFMDVRPGKVLLVPTEAVIQTGRRTVVMLAEDDGRFRPAEVRIGIESGGQTEVTGGLQAGQRVVVSSQFLIDSEASLRGVEARLNNEPAAPAAPAARHQGQGRIEAIDRDSVSLSHGPIPSIGMGAMTMSFKLPPPPARPRGLAVGDRVDFEFFVDPNDGPTVTRLTLLPPAAASAPASGGPR